MKSQNGAGGEQAGLLGIQFGQEGLKGACHLAGIGAFENDVDLIRAVLVNDSRRLEISNNYLTHRREKTRKNGPIRWNC